MEHRAYLARDQKRVEDLDSTGPDHRADACRYGLMKQSSLAMFIQMPTMTANF